MSMLPGCAVGPAPEQMTKRSEPGVADFPIAVGGVGGSGTRVVAELLRRLGVYMGEHFTPASDTLWFTFLFKRAGILAADDAEFDLLAGALAAALQGGGPLPPATVRHLSRLAETGRPHHPPEQLRASLASMSEAAMRPRWKGRWGWKEPNTHVVIERLWQRLPALRYVHVVRNGLDMAFSGNQHQVRLWGTHVLGADGPVSPQRSLAYWCAVHRKLLRLHDANSWRMYWLDFDALCRDPAHQVAELLRFLGFQPGAVDPDSLGIEPQPAKHAADVLDAFAPEDVDFVRSLGY